MHPRRAGESWLPKEDDQLKHELMIGMPFHQIAERHQRTVGAIDARLDRYMTAATVQQGDEHVNTYIVIRGMRIDELLKQNDELSDRIHLDLNPRIKRLTAELNQKKHLAAQNENQRATIVWMQAERDELANAYANVSAERLDLIEEKDELTLSNKRYLVELQAFDEMNNKLHSEVAKLKRLMGQIAKRAGRMA